MIKKYKPLTLSIVIPVFNEERHIVLCLNSIARQTIQPSEVIIVDNNCTDKTVKLASEYSFVRIVRQPKQGRTFARNLGFDLARTDIISRIDADSVLDEKWVENVLMHFDQDPDLAGVTGMGYASVLPVLRRPRTTLWCRVYYSLVRASFRTTTMWGATMAITKTAWDSVKDQTCQNDNLVHEDQDLSLCMAENGLRISEYNDIKITIDGQTYRFLPKYYRYLKMQRQTLALHRNKGTFESPKFERLGLVSVLPGLLYAVPLSIILILFFSVLMYPIDLLMIKLIGGDRWFGNASN